MTEQPQQHCNFEFMCRFYNLGKDPCRHNVDWCACDRDTRSRPVPSPETKQAYRNGYDDGYALAMNEAGEAAAQAREKLLNVIDHEIDQAPEDEHDEDYWRGIAEVHRIIESLRTEAQK